MKTIEKALKDWDSLTMSERALRYFLVEWELRKEHATSNT